MSTITPKTWLKINVLSGVDLNLPDGRPLYAYRCSSDLLEKAAAILTGAQRPLGNKRIVDPDFGPLFVLYAAEWWRNNHIGGTWTWKGIYGSLGWDDLSGWDVKELVIVGLKWWKQEVATAASGQNMYLVTVACQGGLPLKLIRKESNYLRRYFREILLVRESMSVGVLSTISIANDQLGLLPTSLQQEPVAELGAKLIDGVVAARNKIGDIAEYPLEELAKIDPDWRNLFPLELTDGVAEDLLTGLLRQRFAATNPTAGEFSLSVLRHLARTDKELWTHQLEINLPLNIPFEYLNSKSSQVDFHTCNSRLDLRVSVGGVMHRLALLVRDDSNNYWRVQTNSKGSFRHRGIECLSAVSFSLYEGSNEISRWEPEGGDELSTENPLLYRSLVGEISQETRRLEYFASGSYTVSNEAVCLLLDKDLDWQAGSNQTNNDLNQSGSVLPLGEVVGSDHRLLLATERLLISNNDDDIFEIEFNRTDSKKANYFWQGQRDFWEHHRHAVFKGLPKLSVLNDMSQATAVSAQQIQCKAVGQPDWQPFNSHTALGEQSIRVVKEGITLWRSRIVVVPQESSIGIKASTESGTVKFSKFNAEGIVVVQPGIHVTELNLDGTKQSISIGSSENDAQKLDVRLLLGKSRQVTFRLPMPIQTLKFLDGREELIPYRSSVSIENMLGLQAMYLAPDSSRAFIDMMFYADDVNEVVTRNAAARHQLSRTRNGFQVADLGPLVGSVRRLFAMSASIDCRLRLTLQPGAQGNFIEIRRYAKSVRYDSELSQITLRSNAQSDVDSEGTESRIIARSLRNPEIELILPVISESQIWSSEVINVLEGPWLVAQQEIGGSEKIIGRPGVIPLPAGHGPESKVAEVIDHGIKDDLDHCVNAVVCEQSYDKRQHAMTTVLDEMASEPHHVFWEYLDSCLRSFSDFPPSSIDLYNNLIENPQTLAMGLHRLRGEARDQLWALADEMAFDWRMLPHDAWRGASYCYQQYLIKELGGEMPELVENQLKADQLYVKERLPQMEVFFNFLDAVDSSDPAGESARALLPLESMLKIGFDGLKQSLLAEQADSERWPETELDLAWSDPKVKSLSEAFPCWPSIDSANSYQRAILKAPLLASFQLAVGIYPELSDRSYFLILREFDSVWFDEVLGLVLPWAVAKAQTLSLQTELNG